MFIPAQTGQQWGQVCTQYLSAGEDEHQGGTSSRHAPGEQGPEQGLGHIAVTFQHGARPGNTGEDDDT